MKMKRVWSILLILAMWLSLTACGSDLPPADTVTTTTDTTTTVTTDSTAESTTDSTTASETTTTQGDTTEYPVPPELRPTEGNVTGSTTGATSTVPSTHAPTSDHAKPTAPSSASTTVTTTVGDSSTKWTTTTTTTTVTTTTVQPSTEKSTSTVTTTTVTTKHTTTTTTKRTTTTTTTTKITTTTTTAVSADKQLVDRAFQLGIGEKIENVTLTGVVISGQGYSDRYQNATFDLQVEGIDGAKTIYCYRVKPADTSRAAVAVGDRLSLSGTIQNYKGTIEFYPADYTHLGGGGGITTTTTKLTTRPTGGGSAAIDEDGIYESKEDVALYLHTYGKLPKNFVTKNEYKTLGRPANKCCGGDRFYNKEGLLPNKAGRLYYECDIDTYGITSRGTKRIVYSNDGLIYYTGDHYGSFTLLYGTP